MSREGNELDPREGDRSYRLMLGMTSIGVVQADLATGRLLRVNPGFCEMIGFSEKELLGKSLSEITYPDDREADLENFGRMVRGEIPEYVAEERYVRKDGSVIWVQVNIRVTRNGGNKPAHMAAIILDVTERKRGEEALKESEERFRSLSEATEEGVVVHEMGTIVDANASFARIFGYGTTGEVVGMTLPELAPPEAAELAMRHFREGYEGLYEATGVKKDGTTFPIEVIGKASTYRGRPVRVGVVRDITERKRAQEEMRLLERAVTASTNSILITDPNQPDNPIVYVNPAFEETTGYSPEEALGRNCRFLQGEDRDQPALEELRTHIRKGQECRVVLRNYRKDGTRFWNELNIYPVRDENSNVTNFVGVQNDITERRRAEQELKESEERFRATFDQAAVGIAHIALDGTWLRVNDKLCEIVGYTREELLEKTFQDITYPEDLDADLEQAEKLLAGEIDTYSMEKRYIKKDGSIVWINLTGSLVREPSGEPKYFIAVIEDISDRKSAEEQLVYHAGLLENVDDAVLATDERFVLTAWNKGAEQMYGWKASEVLGRNVRRVVRSDYTDEQRAEAVRELSERGRYRTETITYRKDGVPIPTEGITVSLQGEGGRVTGYLSINRDITARKRAEAEIRTRHRQQSAVAELGMRALVNNDLQALMEETVDVVTRTLDVEYSGIFELLPSKKELLLRAAVGWEESVGDVRAEVAADSQVGYSLLSDEPVIVEDISTEGRFRPSPHLYGHGVVSGLSVVIGGREHPFGVLGAHSRSRRQFADDDVSFLQAVANVLATAVERQQAAEKLREVRQTERERMARDLHDEVLQDLTYALAAVQLVESEDPALGGRLEKTIEALKRAGQGLHGAIHDLRLEGQRGKNLSELLGYLVDLNRERWPECRIELSVGAGLPASLPRATEVEVVRIVGEALTNARRHSGARNVHVSIGADKRRLWVEVKDDGQGFNPETTTGTGLEGMSERAMALRGNLKVESEVSRGTKVHFELGFGREHKEVPEEPTRVLLVDDHTSFRDALASLLDRETDFTVAGEAGSHAEARGMLEGVDLAIVDLVLPDGFGGTLIKELRARNPHAQALVLSANLERSEVARAVENGAAGVLHKSARMEEVLEAMRRLRRGETLMPLEEVLELWRLASSRKDEEFETRLAIEQLTDREREILRALAEGLDSPQIAQRLGISVRTERNHMASILAKLGVHSRLQALVFAVRQGLVEIN